MSTLVTWKSLHISQIFVICYSLLTIKFGFINFFAPRLSLENTYFYQLLVSMGITAESLVIAILLNSCFTTKNENENDLAIKEQILRNSFQKNIDTISHLKLLPEPLIEAYQKIRLSVRNIVHLQNWEGKLYETLTVKVFQEKMASFKKILMEIKNDITFPESSEQMASLKKYFFKDNIDFSREYIGHISRFLKRGYGFIQVKSLDKEIYFHISHFQDKEELIQAGLRVSFYIQNGKHGIEAKEIMRFGRGR